MSPKLAHRAFYLKWKTLALGAETSPHKPENREDKGTMTGVAFMHILHKRQLDSRPSPRKRDHD